MAGGGSPKEFDIVIFGATGYTGRYVIEELVNSNRGPAKKWAVAGRNREKLRASLESVQLYLEDDVNILKTPIIEADVNDPKSIAAMCSRAKLILNCVGPYKLYGEVVVDACIANGTHHVDISGEVQYLETTQAEYFKEAEAKGIYVVQACGFDSIPADLGVAILKKRFPGDLNSVESYVELFEGPEGRVTNAGTWLSAIHSVQDVLHASYYRNLLKKIFTKPVPESRYPLKRRLPFSYSSIVDGWCLWFIGPDERVIERSQLLEYQFLNKRPVQVRAYIRMQSFLAMLLFSLFMLLFGFFSLFSFGRHLLGKYPSVFSWGAFSSAGPSRKQVEESSMKVTLSGQGWKQRLSDPTDQHSERPDARPSLVISGPDPAYALTSMCMVHAGMVILDEADKMPLNGGVFTPGSAFCETSLQKRLESRGISFVYKE